MLNDEQLKALPEDLRGDIWEAFGGCTCVDCDVIQRVGTQLANALLALKEAREVLKDVEWCFLGHCPVCGEDHSSGHLDELTMLERGACKLAKILAEAE